MDFIPDLAIHKFAKPFFYIDHVHSHTKTISVRTSCFKHCLIKQLTIFASDTVIIPCIDLLIHNFWMNNILIILTLETINLLLRTNSFELLDQVF